MFDTIIFWLMVLLGLAITGFVAYVFYGIFLKNRPKKEKPVKVKKAKLSKEEAVKVEAKKAKIDEDEEITMVNLERRSDLF